MQDGHIFFALDRTVLSSRLLEGKFPNYQNLLPKGFKIEIGVDRDLLAAAVRRTLVMAQERISPKLVRLLLEGDQMRVQANAPDLGAAEDVVPITKNGPDMEIAFNGKFLLDGLTACPGQRGALPSQRRASAALVRPVSNPASFYLICPVRLSAETTAPAAVGTGVGVR